MEEKFNALSHLVGALLALTGLVVLVVVAARSGDPYRIVSFSIYGGSLLLMYTFSTLYHSLEGRPRAVFRKCDHLSIYLLIAGTYTPFTLTVLRGGWGWSLFGVVWGLAVLGIVIDSLPRQGNRILPLIIYLSMGWLILIALKPLLRSLPFGGFLLLLLGGLFYTVGVVFYTLDERVRYFHGVWHLFVLAGSLNHYFAVLLYLA